MLAPIRHAARAWLALTLVAGSCGALAAQIPRTEVSAGLMMFGQRVGQGDDSSTLAPVQAEVARTIHPSDESNGSMSALAEAQAGLLRARASLSVLKAPADTNFDRYNRAEAHAQFHDDWLITGQPLDTPGRLRVTVRFAGEVVQAASTPGTPAGFGQLVFDLSSAASNDNGLDARREIWRTDNGSADDTRTVELDFLYGRRISVSGDLLARAEITARPGTPFVSGDSTADFSHTAALTQLEVRDAATGGWGAAFDLQTGASTLYPFQAPVPEPGVLALSCGGLLAMGLRAAISRRRRPSAPAGA